MLGYLLTSLEAHNLNNIIMATSRIMEGETTFEDERGFLGNGGCNYPKNINEPILTALFKKDSLFQVNISRSSEENIWDDAIISFTKAPGSIKLDSNYFLENKYIIFTGSKKISETMSYRNVTDSFQMSFCDYSYNLLDFSTIKITFRELSQECNGVYPIGNISKIFIIKE